MRFLYTLFYYAAIPFILLRLLWRSRKNKQYRQRWRERLGLIHFNASHQKIIWIHAVSVGESIAALPLIKSLLAQQPHYQLLVTTTTPTGSQLIQNTLNQRVQHVYVPFDTPTSVNRFLKRMNPVLAIIMETELWPNVFAQCQRKKIPIIIANGRLSERSSLRYQLIKQLTKKILSACEIVLAQSILDGNRFLQLGLDPKKLLISGNIKFDMQVAAEDIARGNALKKLFNERIAFVCASTHEGEETVLLKSFEKIRQQINHILLIIVPRHVERFDTVLHLCENNQYSVARYSHFETLTADTDVLLIDTIGDLRMVYAASDIAFVGGSLMSIGGHNLIEPAILGLPILSGPHLHNFVEISRILKNANALFVVNDADQIAEKVIALCESTDLRKQMGVCAINAVSQNQGALDKHVEAVDTILQRLQRL